MMHFVSGIIVYCKVKAQGGKTSLYDNALFLWHNKDGSLNGMVVTRVDDFVYCGTEQWHKLVFVKILKTFQISGIEECSFKYLGLNVIQNGEGIMIDQKQYVKSFTPVSVSTLQGTMNDVLSKNEVQLLRSLSGQLLWVTSQTRPNAAYDSCFVSNVGKDPKKRILLDPNKAIKKTQKSRITTAFSRYWQP